MWYFYVIKHVWYAGIKLILSHTGVEEKLMLRYISHFFCNQIMVWFVILYLYHLFNYFICLCGSATVLFSVLVFFPSPYFGPISVEYLIYTPIYLPFTPKFHLHLPPYVCRARGARFRGGGVSWLEYNRSRIRAQNYSGERINVPTQYPMPDPNPAPSPAGNWGVELRKSCLSMKLRPQLWSDC